MRELRRVKSRLYGFNVKTLTLDARASLASLSGYFGAAGVKVSSISRKDEFWSILEKIYAFKIDYKFDDSTSLNVACMHISGLSKSERRGKVRKFKTGSELTEKKRIMAKLHKENEAFYAKPKQEKHPSKAQKDEFYKTWDWQKLRMKTLEKYGRRCLCCGATSESIDMTGKQVQIVVDHIKPLHNYWSLRLDPNNTQILCFDCNMGKGIEETDYRPKPAPDEWIVEDDIPAELRDQLQIRH
jgi:5-methylcytosine-specific restriction endonuclease McrA